MVALCVTLSQANTRQSIVTVVFCCFFRAKRSKEKQNLIHSEVSAQKEAVVSAQWKYFVAALAKDQATLTKVQQVPLHVKAKLHSKAVLHRGRQADAGTKATQGYSDFGLRIMQRFSFAFFGVCVWVLDD